MASSAMYYVDAVVDVSVNTPALGPVDGGTRITLLGNGFRETQTLRCRLTCWRTATWC